MHMGKLVFAQLMEHLPQKTFARCVDRYDGHHKVKSFSCMDQYLCMAFAQLTFRESLRDIEACLRSQAETLYHMGIRSQVSRNTLANANATRDWRIYADFAQRLIGKAFFGTSENAVKSQIWIAVSVYVLVAIIKKRLNLSRSLYEMLQILSLNLFERTKLRTALSRSIPVPESGSDGNQLILFT